jgi:hypothetical protein
LVAPADKGKTAAKSDLAQVRLKRAVRESVEVV